MKKEESTKSQASHQQLLLNKINRDMNFFGYFFLILSFSNLLKFSHVCMTSIKPLKTIWTINVMGYLTLEAFFIVGALLIAVGFFKHKVGLRLIVYYYLASLTLAILHHEVWLYNYYFLLRGIKTNFLIHWSGVIVWAVFYPYALKWLFVKQPPNNAK